MKSPVWFSVKYQGIALCACVALLAAWNRSAALAFFLGGLVYLLPHLYFVHYAFRYRGAAPVPLIARSFVLGESGKLMLAALGFALVFKFFAQLSPMVVFAGFVAVMIFQWFVTAILLRRGG